MTITSNVAFSPVRAGVMAGRGDASVAPAPADVGATALPAESQFQQNSSSRRRYLENNFVGLKFDQDLILCNGIPDLFFPLKESGFRDRLGELGYFDFCRRHFDLPDISNDLLWKSHLGWLRKLDFRALFLERGRRAPMGLYSGLHLAGTGKQRRSPAYHVKLRLNCEFHHTIPLMTEKVICCFNVVE
jgi:hypothetical protein